MMYRSMANGALRPSVLGFGCWQLGGEYWGETDAKAITRAIRVALDRGINLFDTAPLYGQGRADEQLSNALANERHNVIIATKAGARTIDGHAQSDLSPSFLRKDVCASLKRLRIDSIPLLQVHWPCQQGTPIVETFEALSTLQSEGKIQHIGVCNYSAEALQEITQICPIVSLQSPFSLIRREFESTLQPLCQQEGIAVLAYEGLCRGLLSGKYYHPPQFSKDDLRSRDPRFQQAWFWHTRYLLDLIAQVSVRSQIPISALMLGWVCAQPSITSVLVGIKTQSQLEENISALRVVNRDKLVTVITKIANKYGGFTPRI